MNTHIRTAGPRRGSRRPKASRNAILHAALVEFAREGLAGARMDAIAEAAGVNKALLYYYFSDKETLYGAVLDGFFDPLVERILSVCDQPGSVGERFLSYARTHFDSIAASPYYAHIFMSELMSASRGGSPHLDRICAKYIQRIGTRVLVLIQEGVKSREFRAIDPHQFMPSAIGSIVHYFLTAPVRRKITPELDTTSPQAIQQRRAAVLDFIAAALFADREEGIKLAAKVAALSPAALRGKTVAPRKPREPRSATSPRPAPAQEEAIAPMQAAAPEITQPPPGGYRWMDRWFPDFETARRVLEEEAKRRRKPGNAKRLTARGKPGGLK